MKVYYINLDRSSERRVWFTQQAETLGLDLVRVAAIDGRQLPTEELDHWRTLSEGNKILSPAEVGCFLSHRKAWEMVCAGDEKWAFITEDDIHLSQNAAAFLSSADWIPAQTDMVKAETDLSRHEFSPASWPAPCGHELRLLKSTHLGSGGYIVTRDAAARMLAFTDQKCEAIDGLLFAKEYMQEHRLQVLQIIPAICIQDVYINDHATTSLLSSIIDSERVENRLTSKKRTVAPFTKFMREVRRVAMQIHKIFSRIFLTLARKSDFITVDFDFKK